MNYTDVADYAMVLTNKAASFKIIFKDKRKPLTGNFKGDNNTNNLNEWNFIEAVKLTTSKLMGDDIKSILPL